MSTKALPAPVRGIKHLWASIAQDLAMSEFVNTLTPEDVRETYGLTVDEFDSLVGSPEFHDVQKKVYERVTAMGETAPITLRAQMLASSILEEVYVQAMSKTAELKDKIKVMERVFQYGGLDPATNGQNKAKANSDNPTNQIIINVPPGIPGLQHIYDNQEVVDGR